MAEINLDSLWANDEWGTTVGDIVRDEIRAEIKKQAKRLVKNDLHLTKAIKALNKKAADAIAEAIEGRV